MFNIDSPRISMFSVKVGTVMEGSILAFRTWAFALQFHTTSAKEGFEQLKLHRLLGTILHRIPAVLLGHATRGRLSGGRRGALQGPVANRCIAGRSGSRARGNPSAGIGDGNAG